MIPTIRLDEENFQEIFETARKRIPLLYSEWTNFNENDSGIALLELFSWLKEVQEFHLNQVGLEHESVYLKLLGIERKEICPARRRSCRKVSSSTQERSRSVLWKGQGFFPESFGGCVQEIQEGRDMSRNGSGMDPIRDGNFRFLRRHRNTAIFWKWSLPER